MENKDNNYKDYIERMKKSPRLTFLHGRFGDIANGKSGQPNGPVVMDESLLQHDPVALAFASIRQTCAGIFNAHYVASLPYILEEQCRFGAGLLLYSLQRAKVIGFPVNLYTLGDASGVMARAMTEISKGKIHTLTCSPNLENQKAFYASNPRPEAHFFHGPFFEVTPERLLKENLPQFHDGFDILVEDTTFQMYGPERIEPVFLACKNLKDDGIFVMLEKVRHEDDEEYFRREKQKDEQFKKRYFTDAQIAEKKSTIIETMRQQEATLEELVAALRLRFKAAIIVWNSGNFYTIAASNSMVNLALFVESIAAPAIPEEYSYEHLPKILFGDIDNTISFRAPGNENSVPEILNGFGG